MEDCRRTVADGQLESLAALRGDLAGGGLADVAAAQKAAREAGPVAANGDPRLVLRGSKWQGSEGKRESHVGIDWLRGSLPVGLLPDVIEVLSLHLGECEGFRFGFWGYSDRRTWGGGVAHVCWDADPEKSKLVHGGKLTLEVHGDALECMPAPKLRELLHELGCLGFECTRVDLMFDDYDRLVEPDHVLQVAIAGDLAGFRRVKNCFEYRVAKSRTELRRAEVGFGGRGQMGSGKYLRVYDKGLESHGEQPCVRWELELTGSYGHEAFELLLKAESEEGLAVVIGGLVGGCVSFPERSSARGDKHLKRMQVHAWWGKIVERLGKVKLRVARAGQTLEKIAAVIERQYGRSLRALDEYCKRYGDVSGMARFVERVAEGAGLKPHHRALIDAAGPPDQVLGLSGPWDGVAPF